MSLKFALQTLFFVTLSSVLIPVQVYSADQVVMEQKMKQNSEKLFEAIVDNKAQRVEELLTTCKDDDEKYRLLTMKDGNDDTPLHKAAYKGYTEVAEVLLAACPKERKFELLTMKNKKKQTPLHMADSKDVAKVLIDACPWNKRYTLLTMKNKYDATPLRIALSNEKKETAKALIQACPYFQRLGLLQDAEVSKLFTPREKIKLILPAMGVVGGSVIGVSIVGYLGYRYFKKKPLSSTIKTITQSQKTSQILRAKGTAAPQITL